MITKDATQKLFVTGLLIIIYNKKAWSFSVSTSVVMLPSWLLAFDRSVYHGRFCFSSSLIHPSKDACHFGLTVHTEMTILHVSQSCQPGSPRRKTTASFFFFPFHTHRQECQSCSLSGRDNACGRDWSGERGCPSLAFQWPQWQMCYLIPELAEAPAGVDIKWLAVSRRENAPPM